MLAFLSLADKVMTELPWKEFSKPRTESLDMSVVPLSLAYLIKATYRACSLAIVIEPSLRETWVVPGGAEGIISFLRISAKSSGGR
jgi:hypothetical protein